MNEVEIVEIPDTYTVTKVIERLQEIRRATKGRVFLGSQFTLATIMTKDAPCVEDAYEWLE